MPRDKVDPSQNKIESRDIDVRAEVKTMKMNMNSN